MIPDLQDDGWLPPGIHEASWEEVEARFGHTRHRQHLLGGLRAAARALADAGCRRVYVDGSFVSSKGHPEDFDACWDPSGVDVGKLDPTLLQFANGRAAQKAKFGGELFPSTSSAVGPPGFEAFVEFFQRTRDGNPKGIIAIYLYLWAP
jgi:hypothetical protein